ncbi:MAG: crossover junction endodeoxyribonuclease RuvC [Candidatus Kryptonium sp.]|nr:crossover junction endodeoxyribonuclease RuvC [Candidatus Kryptonium sp.]MCX7762180.1 crossover junction endodeoxyribonuclease RuvC [Candidatus Kryptonium sp.]MDW8108970.1 crossover junction endodeoxyribonuclease RuvC [Candidatus Kryptonium sp.]
MIVLGIDPGSNITGYGVVKVEVEDSKIDKTRLTAIDYGAIRIDERDIFPIRLKKIYDKITEIISLHKPTEVAIETAFYGKNFQSAFKIGHVRGVVILSAVNFGASVFEYTPREVKKAVVGRGSATKEQVQFMVKAILNLKSFPEFYDVSDALAVAICHINRTYVPEQIRFRDWKAFLKAHPEFLSDESGIKLKRKER